MFPPYGIALLGLVSVDQASEQLNNNHRSSETPVFPAAFCLAAFSLSTKQSVVKL